MLWTLAVTAGGLVSLVGSGGGLAIGFPPCDAPWCSNTPLLGVTVEPLYVTAQVGTSVRFSATVTDAIGSVRYQWYRWPAGGARAQIDGATSSSILVPPANLADDGATYQVEVTDDGPPLRLSRGMGKLSVSSAPGVVIADGEFILSQWTATPREYPPGVRPVHSATRETSGGNPGAWLGMVYQIPAEAGGAAVSYVRSGAVYDPRGSGAIHVIDYAEDCRVLQASDRMYAESELVFDQAGRRYVAPTWTTCNGLNWRPLARASFKATDFTQIDGPACGAGESCPDFSASAAPLQFGFRRFAWGAPGDAVGHGIDNWRVTVWRP